MKRSILALVGLAACSGYRISGDPDVKGTGDTGATGLVADADTDADADADVDADADADADTDSDTDTESTAHTGTVPPWRHTATVDGVADEYVSDETFATTAGTVWITWDATDLYVATEHPDVGGGGDLHWLVLYLGDGSGSGTTSGLPHNTQQPDLPTPFTHVVRWKADSSYDSLETWDGAAWVGTANWLGTNGSERVENDGTNIVELRIPLAAIGAVDTLDFAMHWVYEGTGYESSYAPTPAVAFADGYDPDIASWYAFDLQGPTAPSDTRPSP